MERVAVVTLGNKGLGFAIVKTVMQEFAGVVYLTSRNEARGRDAIAKMNELGLHPKYHQLDLGQRESVIRFRDYIKEKYGGINLLVNRTGVSIDIKNLSPYEEAKHIADTHYFSIITMEELLYPLVREHGRILNIINDAGDRCYLTNKYWAGRLATENMKEDLKKEEITNFVNWYLQGIKDKTLTSNDLSVEGTEASFTVTKVAIVALTRVHQKELLSRNISINCTHSGSRMTRDLDMDVKVHVHWVFNASPNLRGNFVL